MKEPRVLQVLAEFGQDISQVRTSARVEVPKIPNDRIVRQLSHESLVLVSHKRINNIHVMYESGMRGGVSELLPVTLTLWKVLIELEKDLDDVVLLMQLQNPPLGVTNHCNAQEEACWAIIHNPKAFLQNGLQPQDVWQRRGHDVGVINMHRNDDDVSPTAMNEDRNVCVETPKTEFENKGDKVAVPLSGSLLPTIDSLLQQDTIVSTSDRGHCTVWNGHVALLL